MFHFLFLLEDTWEGSRNFLSFGYWALKLFLNLFELALTIIAIFPIVWISDFMYLHLQGGCSVYVPLIFAILYLMVLICVGGFPFRRYLCWKYMIIDVTIEWFLLNCRCIFTLFSFWTIVCSENHCPLFCFLLCTSWIIVLESWTFASENQVLRSCSLQTRRSFDVLSWGTSTHQQIFLFHLPWRFVFP